MKRLLLLTTVILTSLGLNAASKYDNPDTIVVARDGTGEFRTIDEAIEVCREWLQNIEICGESAEKTIITYDDHANVKIVLGTAAPRTQPMGTFRTYTLKIEGNSITLKDLTIENNAARLGQAVALHTEGDRLVFINCRFIGHQDTVYTGMPGTRLFFKDCYICGTTDFIFGPSIAWFENCTIESLVNSYVTAASTPRDQSFGYIFNNCRLTAAEDANQVYLGRPWRDYGYTLFMNCDLGHHIRPEGWHHWEQHREQTARYMEYNNRGEGANTKTRVNWSKQLTKKEAAQITLATVFNDTSWLP